MLHYFLKLISKSMLGVGFNMLWQNPIYRFRIPLSDESEELQEIVFDVTGSAPPFTTVKDTMRGVFEKFLEDEGKNAETFIDYGAAKLRNTLYFLSKGKSVCAVEFQELSDRSSDAKEILEKCKKFEKFENLVFPQPFINYEKKFDVCLLINVLPVMPVFSERLLVLQLLYEKLAENGLILWYAQKEGSYKKIREKGENNFGDGIWMGTNRKYKTFFKYHKVENIDELMGVSGFTFIKKYSAPGNDVRLYGKRKINLFSGIICPEDIVTAIPFDETISDPESTEFKSITREECDREILPNPMSLSIHNLYRKALKSIPFGDGATALNATQYHHLASHIIYRVFRGSLRNMKIEQPMDNGLKRIDTVYTNAADNGFFERLSKNFQVKCPYVLLEAKNYKHDPKNPEFDQLAGRLKNNVGKFGILVCRKIDNMNSAIERCRRYLEDGNKHVIFLTDSDLLNLLELSEDCDNEGIDDFMDSKIRPLIFKSRN